MGETNKRHNRKIWRSCPICKGRVVLGHRNQDWWVYCEDDASHIPQMFFPYAHEAIDEWNVKANKRSNADRMRSMPDEELTEVLINLPNHLGCNDPNDGCMMDFSEDKLCSECVLKWLRQECER